MVHAIAGQLPVYQQDGDIPARVHWAEHPSANARAIRARAARPAFVTLSRTAALAISAPALPRPPDCGITGPPDGHTGMHARLSGARQAGTCRRRGPSVAVRETADGAHRPSWRPGRRPLTCIAAVTASGSAMGRLPFWGVLHCAPLP